MSTAARETRDDVYRAAFADALDYLGRHYGDLHTLWPWYKTPENITVHLGYIGNKMSGRDFEKLNKTVKTRLLNEKIFDELSAGEGGRIHGISLASFLQIAESQFNTRLRRIYEFNKYEIEEVPYNENG